MYDNILRAFEKAPAGLFQRVKSLPKVTKIQAQGDGFDLLLYDVIGCGCCEADDVAQALTTADGAPVRVRLNSPGGDAFTGFAVYNLLNSYKGDLSVLIDGVAASAAAYIAMAGETITMQPASFFMIHNAWTITAGDKNHLQTQISALKKLDDAQAKLFASQSGLTPDDIKTMLDAETWFSADEAVAQGFADDIMTPMTAAKACLRLAQFDPDQDGDDDLAEAIMHIQGAIGECSDAIEALTGTGPDDDMMMKQIGRPPFNKIEGQDAMEFALLKRKRQLQARLLNTRY